VWTYTSRDEWRPDSTPDSAGGRARHTADSYSGMMLGQHGPGRRQLGNGPGCSTDQWAALVQWRRRDLGGGELDSHSGLCLKGRLKQREAGCLEDLSKVLMPIWLRQLP
jgi:hypothetical protein